MKIDKVDVPKSSDISKSVENAYYYDTYQFSTEERERSPLQIWLDHTATTPAWVDYLMVTRNKVALAVGLKDLGRLSAEGVGKQASDYKVGDRIGIFTLLSVSDNEVILGDDDKHLSVKVSVYKEPANDSLVSLSTVVHVNNLLGKAYMLVVKPLHKVIVPSVIARAES